MKTKLTLLGGAAILAATGMGLATEVQAKEVWGKGAPEFQDPDGNIKFKVRGRVQMDYVYEDKDLDNTALTTGTGALRSVTTNTGDRSFSQTRIRRMRLGVEGQFDSKFKYKVEYTFAGRNIANTASATNSENSGETQLEDAYIEYVGGNNWSIVVGHQDLGYTLERLTSSRFSTNMERNLGDQAFGFNRTLGIGLLLAGESFGGWGGQLFVNGDSATNTDIGTGEEEFSIRAHGYWTPINTPEQLLYVGATYRMRDNQNGGQSIQYRARPETNIGDRAVDTGVLGDANNLNSSDNLYSVEAAGKIGPVYAQGEYTMVEADATRGVGAGRYDYSPEFSSYFVQAGWFLTGESRPYKGGKFDRVTPNAPVSEGGIGAWELRARYDYLDVDDSGSSRAVGGALIPWAIDGGTVSAYTVGVNWNPVKNVRFFGEYVKSEVSDRTIPTSSAATTTTTNANGDFDVFQLRAQFDF